MNILDKKILQKLILEESSIYGLYKEFGTTYPTILRHVDMLEREGCVATFETQMNGRKVRMVYLTLKGMVMLTFEDDVDKHWASPEEVEEDIKNFLKGRGRWKMLPLERIKVSRGENHEG